MPRGRRVSRHPSERTTGLEHGQQVGRRVDELDPHADAARGQVLDGALARPAHRATHPVGLLWKLQVEHEDGAMPEDPDGPDHHPGPGDVSRVTGMFRLLDAIADLDPLAQPPEYLALFSGHSISPSYLVILAGRV